MVTALNLQQNVAPLPVGKVKRFRAQKYIQQILFEEIEA